MTLLAGTSCEIDGRKTIRSVVDGMAALQAAGGVRDGEFAKICTMSFVLPDGTCTGVASLVGHGSSPGVVFMAPANEVTAKTTLDAPLRLPIEVIHNAITDLDGNVELTNGQYVHNVVLQHVPFYEFKPRDDEIVHLALLFLFLRSEGDIEAENVPTSEYFDYGAIAQVRLQRLKPVEDFVLSVSPNLSRSIIRSALRRSGMKFPASAR